MLKDTSYNYSTLGNVDITVPSNHAISVLLEFIDKRISGFRIYYITTNIPDKENFITNHLVNYFNSWLSDDTSGYIPYKFSFQKNPAQRYSTKETDIGIFILNTSIPSNTILEFEAKRLSDSSNNNEYVYGDRGGIERFKRGHHSAHLKVCGMFGYVQSRTIADWVIKVNGWLNDLSKTNTDSTIDWSKNEQLINVSKLSKIEKLSSNHIRKQSNDAISLWHYFIDLN